MKQNKGPLLFLTIFTIILFKNNQAIHDAILSSCELFITRLFPSLFPMMVLSDLFIYFDLPGLLCKWIGPVFQRVFHTSPYGAFAFFISSFSGSPANAYTIKNLHEQGYLSATEASHVLAFSFFSNPLFLYTMLSLIFPNDLLTVLKLILLPYVINLLLGFCLRKKTITLQNMQPNPREDFGVFFSKSIKKAMNTLLFILGTVTIFFILNQILNPCHIPIFSGIFEISQGLNTLVNADISYKLKEILAIFFISFGGLSIHLQIKGILSDTKISYKTFFLYRIYQSILSVFLIFVI